MRNNSWVYPLYKKAGDPLHQMYSNVKNDGVLDLEEGRTYDIHIEIKDFAGNSSHGRFKITGKKPPVEKTEDTDAVVFRRHEENYFQAEGIEISLPKGDRKSVV